MDPEPPTWLCPTCGERLEREAALLRCPNRHTFDIAREGYVNLLTVRNKNSREPGDSKGMIRARRQFLEQGHYQPLSEELNALTATTLPATLPTDRARLELLDSGCGEGYYTRRLGEHLEQAGAAAAHLWAIDISKPAIQCAARRGGGIDYAVASNHRLPLPDASLDAALRIYAPGEAAEFRRVLRDDGVLITVTPGPRHLFGLKALIYDTPREHEEETPPEGFTLVERRHLGYQLHLDDSEQITNLLLMTPFYWHINLATRKRVEAQQALTTELDFNLSVYRKA